MKQRNVWLQALPLILIGGSMVYAAAPSGGYLPGATTNPDCAPGDTDCIVQVSVNTDEQTLDLSGSTLSISNGNAITLPEFGEANTDSQTLGISGNDLSITNGNVISLSTITPLWANIIGIPDDILDGDTDNQTLSFSGNTLIISNGNELDFTRFLDDTQLSEAQVDAYVSNNGYLTDYTDTDTQLSEVQVDAYVANNGYLTGYTDTNTDAQTLGISGNDLSISGGNVISLDAVTPLWSNITGIPADILDGDADTQLSEAQVDAYVANNGYLTDYIDTDTDEQELALSGSELYISNGNFVDLSTITPLWSNITGIPADILDGDADTDEQVLSLSGNTLSISNGNSVDLSGITNSSFYEEKDFTMTLWGKYGDLAGATGISWHHGKATKIGRQVHLEIGFTFSGVSGPIASKAGFRLDGLPYTPSNLYGNIDGGGVSGFIYTGISNMRDSLIQGGIDQNGKIWAFVFYTGNIEADRNGQVILHVSYMTDE